nr:MAG TPA: hypothetical protein [Caudoviricetes sp.]
MIWSALFSRNLIQLQGKGSGKSSRKEKKAITRQIESLIYERSTKKDFYKVLLINNGKHYYNTQKLEKQDL